MMTDEAIRMAIAQSVGWGPPKDCARVPAHKWSSPLDGCCYDDLPDFCNDLNAIHEVEATLTEQEKENYIERLTDNVDEQTCDLDPNKGYWIGFIHATARQRAEAYLKSKNLWKE